MHNEAQVLLEVRSSAILDLVGSNQFMSYSLLRVVSGPLPSYFTWTLRGILKVCIKKVYFFLSLWGTIDRGPEGLTDKNSHF